jgi:hypothetical protein
MDIHIDRLARLVADQVEGHIVEIVLGVVLLLVAVVVEVLLEIPVAIRQPHARQRNAQVAGALEMIARQAAQAARVERNGLVQAKLGGENTRSAARQNSARLSIARTKRWRRRPCSRRNRA